MADNERPKLVLLRYPVEGVTDIEAYRFWEKRESKGRPGDPEQDWLRAQVTLLNRSGTRRVPPPSNKNKAQAR